MCCRANYLRVMCEPSSARSRPRRSSRCPRWLPRCSSGRQAARERASRRDSRFDMKRAWGHSRSVRRRSCDRAISAGRRCVCKDSRLRSTTEALHLATEERMVPNSRSRKCSPHHRQRFRPTRSCLYRYCVARECQSVGLQYMAGKDGDCSQRRWFRRQAE